MPNERAAVEVFYSYAHVDDTLRKQLETHLSLLRRQGLISEWHDRKIVAGTEWARQIDAHLESASLILLLISPDFLASDYCYDIEMQRALERHNQNDARVIPIILRPCNWQKAPFAHLQALPDGGKAVTEWANQDAAFRDIATGIGQAIEDLPQPSVSVPPGSLPPVWNIPYARNPVFTGREDLLTRLHTQLQAGQTAALSQAQAISGLGGIGKTQIALEYAYRYRNDNQAVLWMLADSRESLVSGYISLAQLLKLPEQGAQDQQITIQAVKTWLQTHDSWLLILDNADDLDLAYDFLPPTFGGHLLLTTRARATGMQAERLEVETMLPEVGTLFLLRRAKLIGSKAPLADATPADVVTARSICEVLGGLPLALDQAGAYIEEVQCSMQDYLSLYRRHGVEMLKARGKLVRDHPEPVAITWLLSFEKVEQANPAAAELLRLCAFLAPDDIPEEIISEGAEHLGAVLPSLSSAPLLLNRAIGILGAYSLIRRNAREKTLSIHRLVQAVMKDTMDEQTRHVWAERAVQIVNQVFPDVEFETWPQCERYLPHALVCAEQIAQEQISSLEAARLLYEAGRYLIERARSREAQALLWQALALREQQLGPKHTDTARVVDRLARCFELQGNYGQAEPLYKRALKIKEQQLGPEHPSTAASLNNLALLYWNQGKYELAEPLYKRALSINEREYGPEHPQVATNLNNLAKLYRAQGKYELAEPLYKRALSIYEQQLGPEHPYTATSLNDLAALYRAQGKHQDAEPLYKQALSIYEQQLGPEHPYTATSLNNLALLYNNQGKYQDAEPLYQRALAIREQHLGPEHPNTAQSLNNLALLYNNQGKYQDAEPLYKRALSIREQHLGLEHPDTASSLHNLAGLYDERGRSEEAEPLFKRALTIYEQALGLSHPNTQRTRRWYISVLRKLGREEEATRIEAQGQLPSEEY